MANSRIDMTSGPVLGTLIRVAAPIATASLVSAAYLLINVYFVARLGAAEVAAVSAASPLYDVLISLGSGLATAGAILFAQNAGAVRSGHRDRSQLDHVVGQTLLMMGVLAVTFAIGGAALAPMTLQWIGVDPRVADIAEGYLAILYWGMVPQFLYFAIMAMMQSAGEVRFAMVVSIASILLNIALDPLLIFAAGLGVSGAAVATVITQLSALSVMMVRIASGKSDVKLRAAQLVPDRKHMMVALSLAWPASFEQGVRTLSSLLLMSLAAQFGTQALAAYGLGFRLLILFFAPMLGWAQAAAAFTGQCIGAKLEGRAVAAARTAAWSAFLGFSALGLALYPAIPAIMRTLAPDDAGLVQAASQFAFVYFPFLGILALPQVLNGVFRGAGSPKHAMGISIAMQWLFQIPAALVLSLAVGLGVLGVWWSYPIGNGCAALLAVAWLRFGRWRKDLTAS